MEKTRGGAPAQETLRIPVRGGTLHVRVAGRGPPVLLLHGASADGRTWDGVARLAGERTLVWPDLLGRGRSRARSGARFRLRDEVERVVELARRLELDRPLLVGHSHGAGIALGAAGRLRPRGLVLVCPVTPDTSRPRGLGLLRLRAVRRLVGPPLRHFRLPLARYILERRVFADPAAVTPRVVARHATGYRDLARIDELLRALADWRPRELAMLPAPAAPTVVIAAGRDRRVRVDEARRWADRLGARFILVREAGHGLPEECPDRLVAWLGVEDRRDPREQETATR